MAAIVSVENATTYKSPLFQMTQTTETCLWNDSATLTELTYSIDHGGVGATCNPVIVLDTLKKEPQLWNTRIAALANERPTATEDEIGWAVVREISVARARRLHGTADATAGSRFKRIRGPIAILGRWSRRVWNSVRSRRTIVKLPVTSASVRAIEELTYQGVSINATVSFTVPQCIQVAEAIERGMKRREAEGKNTSTMGLEPVDERIVAELFRRFPDFQRAYTEDGLSVAEFDTCAPRIRTLRQFIEACHELAGRVPRYYSSESCGVSKKMKRTCFLVLLAAQVYGLESLSQRLAHTDPSKFKVARAVHGGAGTLNYTALLSEHSLETNLNFFHRGILNPHSGAGNHLHYYDDEMYFILEGEAQFTVDGRTSVLKGPAGALCPLGHSHALYNATDKPIQWMNISVSSIRGKNSSYNMNDTMEKVTAIDPIPYFVTMTLDHSLLRPVERMSGGTGTIQYRRALQPQNFSSPWAYVDDVVLPSGSSVGKHLHREVAEVYYVVSGEGSFSVATDGGADEIVSIHSGDAVPLRLNEVHWFKNTGSAPLELMVIGVSRDPARVVDSIDYSPSNQP